MANSSSLRALASIFASLLIWASSFLFFKQPYPQHTNINRNTKTAPEMQKTRPDNEPSELGYVRGAVLAMDAMGLLGVKAEIQFV